MTESLILAAAALGAVAMLCFTALRAWRGWLEIRRLEVDRAGASATGAEHDVGLRIELAGVKERLKKLEAIASGVEL
ncbi:MAG: hypothetical protein ACXWUP_11290 [Allosphingosinicella sp.]